MVLASTIELTHGGGQRTSIIYHALLTLGPVVVVILGPASPENAAAAFPGARDVLIWPEHGAGAAAHGIAARGLSFLQRYLLPERSYAVDAALEARLRALFQRHDVALVVYRLFLTFAISGAPGRDGAIPPAVVDIDDRDDQKARARIESLFGALATRTVFQRLSIAPLRSMMIDRLADAALAWFVADEDGTLLESRAEVIENAPLASPAEDSLTCAAAQDRMLFVGPAYFPPNRHGMTWFLRECWPMIVQAVPSVRLAIVGDGDWRACVASAGAGANIEMPGRVERLGDEYMRSRFTICPISEGGGSKIKLVESCAFARPVVATPHSCRGYAEALTRDLLVGATAAEFAAACIRLLTDDDEVRSRGARLRTAQQRFHSRDATIARMSASLKRLLATGTGGRPIP